MKGEFRREMCDLAVKQAQAMNQVRKMGWVDEFCNEVCVEVLDVNDLEY